MPYTHHSHSGSYCKHAHDTLDSVIATAIRKQFRTFCLTEHVPRLQQSLVYPEEEELGMTPASLKEQFYEYVDSARTQQLTVNSNTGSDMRILVGFESEGGIDDEHLNMCIELRNKMNADIVVGSVHHVNGIDIDFDQPTWRKAYEACDGLRGLYREYYKLVRNMIQKLKPEVVAHFDLIRLFAFTEIEETKVIDGTPQTQKRKITLEEQLDVDIKRDWHDVWAIIEEAVDLIIINDLTVELNSAAIRKGWNTPYPKNDIMRFMITKGVKFVMSDDSHGDDQVGLNYHLVLEYIKQMGIETMYYYDIVNFGDKSVRDGMGNIILSSVSIEELVKDPFWQHNYPSFGISTVI